jgi:hypothetical protein
MSRAIYNFLVAEALTGNRETPEDDALLLRELHRQLHDVELSCRHDPFGEVSMLAWHVENRQCAVPAVAGVHPWNNGGAR